jgi:uncharacterized membrane protein YdjX (TVP38/TMEM64 family)
VKKDNLKDLIKYIIILCICILIIYIFFKYNKDMKHLRHIQLKELRRYVLSYGKYAIIIFILFYTIKPVLIVFPASLLSILAGNLFGPVNATLLSLFCCFTSGTVAFSLSHILGKPFVDKLLKGKALKIDDDLEKNGFIVMAIMRLSFIFPYDALSYAAGLTKMKYKDFILGTIIGILPEMITYSFIGQNLRRPFSIKFFIPIFLLIVVALASFYGYKLYKSKKEM